MSSPHVPAAEVFAHLPQPYRFVRELGRGGMGVVAEADDGVSQVAVKALLPHLAADDRYRTRFLQEARAMAACEHDHVARIHFVAQMGDPPVPFLVMPKLRGCTLYGRLCVSGPLSEIEVLRIGREAACGLAAVHLRLIHRDLKPANIWLEDPLDRVKLLDFGLALSLSELSLTGEIGGTPAYMSPEQTEGKRLCHRSDLFSLGTILYELASGKRPFVGDNIYAVMTAVREDEPKALPATIPPTVSELILWLLRKKPDDRPESAEVLAEYMRRLEANLGVEVPLPQRATNPFSWRAGITDGSTFFGRGSELRRLRAYLGNGSNCQLVGERRIGKTSLLLHLARLAPHWGLKPAYVDLQDPQCFTLTGLLAEVGRAFGWSPLPASLTEFSARAKDSGGQLVLCLDEFEMLSRRKAEFTRDFFLTLRSCSGRGLSIVTASRAALSTLTDPTDDVSPFYNTFPLLSLGAFTAQEAEAFVDLPREGVVALTAQERAAALAFAQLRPLALQVACFHVLEGREDTLTIDEAMRRAGEELRGMVPEWGGGP